MESVVTVRGNMQYKVAIKSNATREIRLYDLGRECHWNDASYFLWTQGNYSCDCNRELSFIRAGGPGSDDDPHHNNLDTECGHDRYSILYAELEDGTHIEFDDTLRLR